MVKRQHIFRHNSFTSVRRSCKHPHVTGVLFLVDIKTAIHLLSKSRHVHGCAQTSHSNRHLWINITSHHLDKSRAIDQPPYPPISLIFSEKHRANAKRNYLLIMQQPAKERQHASKPAPRPTVLTNSYSARLATFTSWPHSNPSASVMAKAGFRQVHGTKDHDRVKCSKCDIWLSDWKPDDDPTLEHSRTTGYSCFRVSERVVCEYKAPAPTETTTTLTNLSKSPPTSTTATSTVPEMSLSTENKPHHAGYHIVSPAPRDVVGKLLDRRPNDAPAKTDALPSPMDDVVLDNEDWVDLGFEGEEKDGWIEV